MYDENQKGEALRYNVSGDDSSDVDVDSEQRCSVWKEQRNTTKDPWREKSDPSL